ncbi:MAG TPA: homoserine kinase [Ideonella sp.]|uniref:homoserine kinase n=1 Tax=Ideonella sp. TaxID=1929293 RepID=UPI002E2ED018|nr:homoserine kinase [Ideonella sp.]HEX5684006.1 homoserine kinase [Ideonella sp.]
MAVYTEVSLAQAQALSTQLKLGAVRALEPIGSGIENTNYFLTTDAGEWVLTLFERLSAAQLPFYLQLMQHLAQHGLPVPEPHANGSGVLCHDLAGKPAAVVNRLPGVPVDAPDVHHADQVGATLARMHKAVADFAPYQPNLRGLAWWQATAPLVRSQLDPDSAALLDAELAYQVHLSASPTYAQLPHGAVHADLFRDNALFDGLPGRERLCGVIDFYFAGVDSFAFDLGVAINDWCIDDDSGHLDETRANALIAGYRAEREPTGVEWRTLPAMRRAAALRFWLSRLADWHAPRDAALLTPKDPRHFERVLRDCVANPWHPGA